MGLLTPLSRFLPIIGYNAAFPLDDIRTWKIKVQQQ